MSGLEIQKLGPADGVLAQQLIGVFRRAFEEDGAPPSDEYLSRLLQRDDFHAVVALQNGVVIGGLTAYELTMFGSETRELFIYDIAVDAAHRRQGVGRALIEWVKALCSERGITSFYVGAMADEPEAVAFYESTGLRRETVAWFVQELERME